MTIRVAERTFMYAPDVAVCGLEPGGVGDKVQHIFFSEPRASWPINHRKMGQKRVFWGFLLVIWLSVASSGSNSHNGHETQTRLY
jgi:hypothetical protein